MTTPGKDLMLIRREPIERITNWLSRETGDAPDSPTTLPWRLAKISEEIGEAVEAYRADDPDSLRSELRDIILTTEVAAFSLDPDSLPRRARLDWAWEEHGWSYMLRIAVMSGRATSALFGMTGRNPRKGVTHTPQQALRALHDLSDTAASALAALSHPDGPQAAWDNHLQHVINRSVIR